MTDESPAALRAERDAEPDEADGLEWYDKPGDEEESHVIAGGCPPGWWTARRDYGKIRRSDDWGLWLGGEHVARADTLDEAKALAQLLQDVLDGVPDRSLAAAIARGDALNDALVDAEARYEFSQNARRNAVDRGDALEAERDEALDFLDHVKEALKFSSEDEEAWKREALDLRSQTSALAARVEAAKEWASRPIGSNEPLFARGYNEARRAILAALASPETDETP